MSITDELREWMRVVLTDDDPAHAIADRIDAEHQKALDEWKAENGQMWLKGYSECHAELMEGNETLASDLERCGWVRLPLDADGVPIHVGDEMEPISVKYDRFGVVTLCMDTRDGRWSLLTDLDGEWSHDELCQLRHYTPPTVEDILMEFHERMDELGTTDQCVGSDRAYAVDALLRERAELVAEYAAKLRLAGDAE